MKKYDGVLKRVQMLEEKQGIKYAKEDGKLYKTFKVFYILFTVYTFFMNLFYILGMLLLTAGERELPNEFFAVCIGSVLLIAGFVVTFLKLHIASAVLNLSSSVILIIAFGRELYGTPDLFNFTYSFYWRHFIPLVLIILCITVLCVVALRARHKLNSMYKKVEENLYNLYHTSADEVSEEQWQEFIENYNGESLSKIIME